jgi:pimeloyl-ACP methyl ester carboxylesterase
MSSNPKIAKLYQDVPQEAFRNLEAFRERYPYQSVTLNGRHWHYIDTQAGDVALFIPAGGTSVAEVSFKSIEHFAQNFRVVSPDYPPIDTLEELFEGFNALLEHLGVNKFYTLGGSYGGWIVQSLVRKFPDRVNKLVITVVGPPDPENSQQLARLMPWLSLAPTFMLRSMINRTFASLESKKEADPDLALLWALVKEVTYFRVGKADILAGLDRLIDQTQNYTFSPEDLQDWPGSILILFGSEDPGTPREKQEEMRQLYPQAEVKVFEGGEHGIALSHQQEYFSAIDEFLSK